MLYPIKEKTIDILEDRKVSPLRNHFLKILYNQRKKVKIITMDLLGTSHSLFPHTLIITDKFYYIKFVTTNMVQSRLDTCASLTNKPLGKSIKRNLHLFNKYNKDLDDKKAWYDYY